VMPELYSADLLRGSELMYAGRCAYVPEGRSCATEAS
jgi:hypothetical protein